MLAFLMLWTKPRINISDVREQVLNLVKKYN